MHYFWENFIALCCQFDKTPTAVTRELGISKSLITHWKDGGIPRQVTLKKIADYFGVSVGYFSKPQKASEKKIDFVRFGTLCIERNISFSSIGRTLGIDPLVFSGNHNVLSGEYAPLIAKFLGTTVEYLTGESDEKDSLEKSFDVIKVTLSPQEASYILELRTNPMFKRGVEDAYRINMSQSTIADDARQTVESASALPIKKK